MWRKALGVVFCALLVMVGIGSVPGNAGASPGHVKPGIPIGAAVTSADTALVVSWSPPASSGSSAIQGYVVVVHQGRVHPTCTMTAATTCLAAGLTNGRPVTIRIRAYNGVGSGKSAYVAGIPGTAQNCSYVGAYANLQGCNLSFAVLTGRDLTGANLTGADLYDVSLQGANLTNANLTSADLEYVSLSGASLQGARLAGADVAHLTSGGVTGTPASLPTGWGIGGGYLMGPGVNLSFADLSGAVLPAADLTGASFYDANLSGATLSAPTTFASTDLEYATLSGTHLQGANLAGTDLAHITSGGVTGTPASLPTGWGIGGGYLMGPGVGLSFTDLSGVGSFPAADLTAADFYDSDLSGGDLTSVTSLEGADLAYADLSGANLTGEDLTGATLAYATLAGVIWSNTTCPDGSNSDAHGGTCVGFGI